MSQGFKGDEATYYSLTKSLATRLRLRVRAQGSDPRLGRVPQRTRRHFPEARQTGSAGAIETVSVRPPRQARRSCPDAPLLREVVHLPAGGGAVRVSLFGTHGFLVLHALLLAFDVYRRLSVPRRARQSARCGAAYAVVFLAASVVPVYFVWLTPELFNVSLVLYAVFLWCYKEVRDATAAAGTPRFLLDARSDYLAAALIGVLTFSKPPHAILLFPVIALALSRRQWRRAAGVVVVSAACAGGLFAANAAITGEFNYQAGDRKTFYGRDGFPFANARETFENIGPLRERGSVMVGDVLANQHTLTVLRHDIVYFVFGRFSGLVPYFFPGVVSALLFLVREARAAGNGSIAATIGAAALALLVADAVHLFGRRRPGRQSLFSELLSAVSVPDAVARRLRRGGCRAGRRRACSPRRFVVNPLYASFHPGDHTKSGPLHMLPIELTLLNDLPMAFDAERSRRPLAGHPPLLAYFPDDGRVPAGGGRVLAERQVARRCDSARAGRRGRRREVRVEDDCAAGRRAAERRRTGPRDDVDRRSIADVRDEAGRGRAVHACDARGRTVSPRRESDELPLCRLVSHHGGVRALPRRHRGRATAVFSERGSG